MLKSTLASELLTSFGDGPDDSDSLTEVNSYIDDALKTIFIKFGWDLLEVLSELTLNLGNNTLALGTQISRVKKVYNKTRKESINYRSYVTLLEENRDLTLTQPPRFWFESEIDNDSFTIQFDSIADSDYQIEFRYQKQADETLGDNEHIPLPAEFIPWIKYFCKERQYADENQGQANYYKIRGDELLLDLIKRYGHNPANRILSPMNSDLRIFNKRVLLRYPAQIVDN